MLTLEPGALYGGRYQIVRSLGAGGMGEVFLARDPNNPEFKLALKVLYQGVLRGREARERFRNEILSVYRVRHPNVVRAYDYFEENDRPGIALEYISGGDLSAYIRSYPPSIPDIIRVLRGVASGLSAIHSQGIIHRDLKPENILITLDGTPKISDFGVARLHDGRTITEMGMMVGTPKYVSPEYVETGECDHRGDIYALGVIAYEMVSGESPFSETSRNALLLERFKIPDGTLRRAANHCPPPLARVIEKAMSVNVYERYQSAAEFEKDLARVERGEVSETLGSHSAYLPMLLSKVQNNVKKRWGTKPPLVILLTILSLLALFLLSKTQPGN